MVTNELRNYDVVVRITDRQMKPQHLNGTPTKERVFFDQPVDVKEVKGETDAKLGAVFSVAKLYPIKRYDISVVSIKERVSRILVPKLIIPGR